MNPLAQLADISAPTEVSIWPLAWGYWLAIVVVIASLVLIILSLVKRYQLNKQKKSALLYLKSLPNNDTQYAAKIQVMLKQLCEHYFSKERASMMHGEAWLAFVKIHYKGSNLAALENALHLIQTDIYAATQTYTESQTLEKHNAIKTGIKDWISKSLPVDPARNKKALKQKLLAKNKVNAKTAEETTHV